jgi:hypothetical protein
MLKVQDTTRKMKLLIQKHILASLIPLATLLLLHAIVLAGQHRVIRFIDGETIVVDYYGKAEKVRFLCVNTPESVQLDPPKMSSWEKLLPTAPRPGLRGRCADLELQGSRKRDSSAFSKNQNLSRQFHFSISASLTFTKAQRCCLPKVGRKDCPIIFLMAYLLVYLLDYKGIST